MKNLYDLAKEKTIVIAEIGINHNGDCKLAEEMIAVAADCGVDAVKFQAFKTERMYSRFTPGFSHTDRDVFSQMRALEIQDSWWTRLRKTAEKNNLYFAASIFDPQSLSILKTVGLDFIKVASAEINHWPLLKEQLSLSDTFVISTGMALLEEISRTVRFFLENHIDKIFLLECTSSYPAPSSAIHLLNIDFLKNTFNFPAGYSDHTLGIHHAIAAAARGACIIEKHFTLDKKMTGPDHSLSADPQEMGALVVAIRDISQSLQGNEKRTYAAEEKESRSIGRRSIVALRDIKINETITESNTICKRPGLGISPDEAPYLYGRKASKAIRADHWLTWEMVK